MNKKLSEFMRRTLAAIDARGGKAVPAGGGYWNGADGTRLEVEPVGDSTLGVVGTATIHALEERGYLMRDNLDKASWHDSRSRTDKVAP